MPRQARRESNSGIYHVTARGAGRRRLFEDDKDRLRFVERLRALPEKDDVRLLAWCLMDNHAHLLAQASVASLSNGLHRLATSYAHYFNGRHGHVGPVFQGRFDSAPVETEAHLLAAIRYIHLNPLDTGASHPRDCPWNSYGEYVGKPRICDTSLVLELVGGAESFEGYCDPSQGHDYLVSLKERGPYLSEAEAERVAASHLGADFADRLALLDKSERDRALRKLRALGLSVRQIERLTGVGRNIVARA